jgi:hypothetical protein
MAKKKDSVKQPSLKDQLAASRRINDNIAGRVREEEEEQEEEEEEGIVPENMTVAELKAALDEAGVEYKSDDKKADLVQLYSDWLADQQGEEEEEEQE